MAFKKILVAIDGSETSEKVLGTVAGIADSLSAEIVLLAVTGSHAFFEEVDADNHEVMIGDETKGAESHLEHLAVSLREYGLNVTNIVKPGIPSDVILSVATEIGSDLIAMATHRGNALARGILGSVTDTVLRSSSIPVLAINPDGTNMTRTAKWKPATVIVPLDGSKLAEECVPTALNVAKATGAELIFMQALHLPSYAVSGPGADFYGLDFGVSAQRRDAAEYLAQFVEIAKSEGVSASTHTAIGSAAARIIEETQHVPDAMIVISSHGRRGFRRMVLGSVADKILRASHHPVLVLKHSHNQDK